MNQTFEFIIPGFESRTIRVFNSSSNEYSPLIIFFDGQNVFDDHGSFAGGWFAHKAIQDLDVKPIIVGINNGGMNRIHELPPYPYKWSNGHTKGLGKQFISGIIKDLLPELHERYKILPGSHNVTIAGSSLGGLASIYAHLKYPNVFGKALAMSTSFFTAHDHMEDILSAAKAPKDSKIYLDAGEKEAHGHVSKYTKWFHASIISRGYEKDNTMFVNDMHGEHNERSWARRLPDALKFLLG